MRGTEFSIRPACDPRGFRGSRFSVSLINMKVARPYRMRARAAAAAETADKIIDATGQLFTRLPIAAITLADIAERSGVTVQTILRRFGDKDAVFAEAIAGLGAEILRQRGQAIPNDLDDLLANLVEHYETHGRLVLKMLGEESIAPAIRPVLDSGRDYHRCWCETVFAATLESLTGAEGDRRRAQLIAICDVRTWEVLRIRLGLSRSQTQAALREMLEPLTKEV